MFWRGWMPKRRDAKGCGDIIIIIGLWFLYTGVCGGAEVKNG
jgi:hypothetical protein